MDTSKAAAARLTHRMEAKEDTMARANIEGERVEVVLNAREFQLWDGTAEDLAAICDDLRLIDAVLGDEAAHGTNDTRIITGSIRS